MFRPDPDIISANESRATRIAVVAIAVPALLIGLIALVVAPWWLALILAVLVAVFMWWRASSAESKLLTAVGAKPADPKRHARLVNLADGLAVQAGVRVPELMVVESDVANAMAVGRDERSAAVVVTSGLLDRLGRVELEGVLAQLFAELRSGDVELRTATYAHGAPLAAAAQGLYAKLIDRAVDPDRRFRNDAAGVAITRFPPGLVAAYEALDGHAGAPGPTAAAHLWMIAPVPQSPSHPATATRIAALREL